MTKKRKLVVLGVAAVGLVAGPLLSLQSLPKTPFQAKYARVRRGMTVEEVHAIMGEPNRGLGMAHVRFCELEDWLLKRAERSSVGTGTVPARFS
jgi:hypothetical protein